MAAMKTATLQQLVATCITSEIASLAIVNVTV